MELIHGLNIIYIGSYEFGDFIKTELGSHFTQFPFWVNECKNSGLGG